MEIVDEKPTPSRLTYVRTTFEPPAALEQQICMLYDSIDLTLYSCKVFAFASGFESLRNAMENVLMEKTTTTTENKKYLIRSAASEEIGEAVNVINLAFAEAYKHVRPAGSPPRTTCESVHQQCTAGGCTLWLCVEVSTGQICGTVMVPSPHADFDSAGRNDTESFGSLAVRPSSQRQGIGKLLMADVEKKARESGKARIELCFAHGAKLSDRPKLAFFYENVGFVQGERKEKKKWFDILPEFCPGLFFQQMVKLLN